MRFSTKNIGFKAILIVGLSFGLLLLLMFLMPILFPGTIAQEVKSFANRKLKGELNFKEAKLSFFNHFPSLTLTLTDFSVKGSTPFQKQNLIASEEVAFGINLKNLIFNRKINIDQIYISQAKMNVLINEKGQANYNVYVSDKKRVIKDSSTTSLRLEKIVIENSSLKYHDKSAQIVMDARGLYYRGKGDLDKAVFDLKTKMEIASFDFVFAGEKYLIDKKIDANLLTQINTNSLAFVFRQNNLIINQLPIDFIGKLDFLKSGYDIDFNVQSNDSDLHDVFTALPPHYVNWLGKTEMEGRTDLLLTFKGRYSVAENKKPDLALKMKVRDGFVNYNEAAIPASNIYLDFETQIPGLDTNTMYVKVDSLFFNLDNGYCSGSVETQGIENPKVNAKIKAQLDLGKLHRAIGLQNMDFTGVLNADIVTKGIFNQKQHLFPVMKGNLMLQNASLRTIYYPNPIEKINLNASVVNPTGLYKDLSVRLYPADFHFEGKPVYLEASVVNFDDMLYDIKAKGELDLERIYKVFSRKKLDIKGYIKADLTLKGKQSDATKGNYDKLNNKGILLLRNIRTKTDYLPKPFVIQEGLFVFNQNRMDFKNFRATYGQSDFTMNGQMQNAINFILTDNATLKGNFVVQANYILVDEFMYSASATELKTPPKANSKANTTTTGVVIIPDNLDFNLTAQVQKVRFEGLDINQLKGNLSLQNGLLQLKKTQFDLIGSPFAMEVTYKNRNYQKAEFEYWIKAEDFDVKKAYMEIKMFRDMVAAAKNAEGFVSLDYKLSGHLDQAMNPIYPSLTGSGVLKVRDVQMKGFKLFNAVGKKTGKEGFKDLNLKAITINSKVKNNIITIDRFKFKVAGFRPRIEGQTSLDGKLNLKMRLGLPPLGIIGIPLKITGTSERPKIKMGKNTEDLEESEYQTPVKDTLK